MQIESNIAATGYVVGPATLQASIGTEETNTNQTPQLRQTDIMIMHQSQNQSRQPGQSPVQGSSKGGNRASFEVGGLSLPDMLKNATQSSQILMQHHDQQVKMMKLLSDGNAMLTYELGLIPSALMGQRMIVTAQQPRRIGGPPSPSSPHHHDTAQVLPLNQRFMDPLMFSSGQVTSLNSTLNGTNVFNQTAVASQKSKSHRFSSVRQSGGGAEKRKSIEFRILKMNLAQPPTAEKSNMMTCELDLSSHVQNKYGTTLSKTLNLSAAPNKLQKSSGMLQGTSIHLLPQQNQESMGLLHRQSDQPQSAPKTPGSRQQRKRDLNFFLQRPLQDHSRPSLHLSNSKLANPPYIATGTVNLQTDSSSPPSGLQTELKPNSELQGPHFNTTSSAHRAQTFSSNLGKRSTLVSNSVIGNSNHHYNHQMTGSPSSKNQDIAHQLNEMTVAGALRNNTQRPPNQQDKLKSPESTSQLTPSAMMNHQFAVNVVAHREQQPRRSSALFKQPQIAVTQQINKKNVPRLQLPNVVGLMS